MELLSDSAEGVGYLLEDRVAEGASAIDPAVVARRAQRAVAVPGTTPPRGLAFRRCGLRCDEMRGRHAPDPKPVFDERAHIADELVALGRGQSTAHGFCESRRSRIWGAVQEALTRTRR